MTSCKNCLHVEMCYQIEHFGHDIEEEANCKHFKDKADFVEVVRCKDCEYYTEDYEDRYGNKFGRCDHPQQGYDLECYDMWVETKPNDFCSYGERKEGEKQ